MQSCLKFLLLLAVGTAATVTSSPQVSWTIRDAVNFYNNGSNTDYIFKLVETDPEYGLDESLRPQQLQFMLKETECLKTEKKNIEDCGFQETGTIKVCSAILLVELERNAIVINCESHITEDESLRPQQQQFMMKETECLKSEKKNIVDCDFQETGTMKACSAFLLVEPERNAIVINCDSPIPEHVRVRRASRRHRRPGRYLLIGHADPSQALVAKKELQRTPQRTFNSTKWSMGIEKQ